MSGRHIVSISELCGHVAMWAVRQSPYAVPPNLETVLLRLHMACEPDFTEMDQRLRSFDGWRELEGYLRAKLFAIPAFMAWNEPRSGRGGKIAFVSRYSRPSPDDDFIDLDALLRNVCMGIIRDSDDARPVSESCAQPSSGAAARVDKTSSASALDTPNTSGGST